MDDTVGGQKVFVGDDSLPVDCEHVPTAAHLQCGALQGLQGHSGDNGLGTQGRLQDVVVQQVYGRTGHRSRACRGLCNNQFPTCPWLRTLLEYYRAHKTRQEMVISCLHYLKPLGLCGHLSLNPLAADQLWNPGPAT